MGRRPADGRRLVAIGIEPVHLEVTDAGETLRGEAHPETRVDHARQVVHACARIGILQQGSRVERHADQYVAIAERLHLGVVIDRVLETHDTDLLDAADTYAAILDGRSHVEPLYRVVHVGLEQDGFAKKFTRPEDDDSRYAQHEGQDDEESQLDMVRSLAQGRLLARSGEEHPPGRIDRCRDRSFSDR